MLRLCEIIPLSPEHFPIGTVFLNANGLRYRVVYTMREYGFTSEDDFLIGCVPNDSSKGSFELSRPSEVMRIVSCPVKRINSLHVDRYETQHNGPDSVSWYYIKLCQLFGVSIKRDKAYKHFFFSDIVMTAINQMGYGAVENFNPVKMISLVEKQSFVKQHMTKDSDGEYHSLFVINKRRLKRFIKQNANRCLCAPVHLQFH